MKPIKILLSTVLFAILSFTSFSQIEVGTWREHFSYKNAICVTDANEKVYVAGELAIFSFDKEEGSIETLSKVNGLSDSEIQTIAYNKFNNTLVVAYVNSNIDIIKDNVVYNITEIKRKQISYNKTINKITFLGNKAYLSCGFGIVVLDVEKKEISDTYFIGENSSYKNINDVCIFNSTIYAATDEGLFYADINNANLTDYRNWHIDETIPDNLFKITSLSNFNQKLFVAQENFSTKKNTIYYLKNMWQVFKSNINEFKNLNSTDDYIAVISKGATSAYDKSLNRIAKIGPYSFLEEENPKWPNITSGIFDGNKFYITDRAYGLVYGMQEKMNFIYPNGPTSNKTARVEILNNMLIATNGNNRMKAWHNPEYNVFENEQWQTYGISKDTARNFYSIAINPNNPQNIFIGAFGYGIFEFNNNEWQQSFNHLNSSLQTIAGYDYGYIRITDLAFDKNNNLWVSNHLVSEPISVKNENDEWQSFNFNGQITDFSPGEIIVTEDNNKWFLLGEGEGILVLDDNNTPLEKSDDTYKKFSPTESNGDIISSTVTAIEEDKDGNVWLGTSDGVAIYYNPSNVFEDNFYADKVQLTSYGQDTTEQYLFITDAVTDIETDGANRKWIATQNSGVFLISENGKDEITNFNIYNSPIISNTINDIAINHKSGEIFILTDKGILSYRSDATKAEEDFGDVFVFPNPVRPDYTGKITVTGLADEVNVKFTDISGNLVFETTALGGQAIWDGKTFDGQKVSTGIYLVFCTNEDGTKTQVSKLLFLN